MSVACSGLGVDSREQDNIVVVLFHKQDLKNQVLKTAGYLDVVWRDEYLHWDPSHYVHVTDFLIPQSLVWLPDAVISNE
nr:hypothetical protein BaRGS_012004 [Batillaria attramentaria]